MTTVLVTGGAGFIGSHICEMLVKEGFSIRVIDDLSSSSEKNLSKICGKIEFIRGSITNWGQILSAVEGCDFVVHCAALCSVQDSMENPLKYHKVNVDGILKVLESSRINKVKRVIFCSSAAVYGDAGSLTIDESFALNPVSFYAESKMIGEKYCNFYSKYFGIDTISLRFFNVYGERQGNNGYPSVISSFLSNIKQNKNLIIFGEGDQTRDFVHVKDVAAAVISSLKYGQKGPEVFNVASGNSIKLIDLAKFISKKKEVGIKFLPRRIGDINFSQASIYKIKSKMGWFPKRNFFDEFTKMMDFLE